MPYQEFNGPWHSDSYREYVDQLITKIGQPRSRYGSDITLIVSTTRGVDGELIDESKAIALQAAIDVGVISSNPTVDNGNGSLIATSDNTEVHIWDIDVRNRYVSYHEGGLVRVCSGGWDLSEDDWRIPYPIELSHSGLALFDSDLAIAIYDVVVADIEKPEHAGVGRQLATAIRWWSKAWRNTRSIRMTDRIVFLKTAFEALTGESKGWRGAQKLRCTFERLLDSPHLDAFGSGTLLWSADECPDRVHHYDGKTSKVTDLEHWFLALADCRNEIIHEGTSTAQLAYDEPGSVYAGPFFWIGSQVFLDTLKVQLATVGYPDLWLDGIQRASLALSRQEVPGA